MKASEPNWHQIGLGNPETGENEDTWFPVGTSGAISNKHVLLLRGVPDCAPEGWLLASKPKVSQDKVDDIVRQAVDACAMEFDLSVKPQYELIDAEDDISKTDVAWPAVRINNCVCVQAPYLSLVLWAAPPNVRALSSSNPEDPVLFLDMKGEPFALIMPCACANDAGNG